MPENPIDSTDPINLFNQWLQQEVAQSRSTVPQACCLSTLGTNGYPNARFVSLKTVHNGAFIITGGIKAQKGIELQQHPKAALTFWFDNTQRQVRIQGNATPVSEQTAARYFAERKVAAKVVSLISQQSQPLVSPAALEQQFNQTLPQYQHKPVPKPAGFGGFAIEPVAIELLAFEQTRLHLRQLFTKTTTGWQHSYLQP